MRKYYKHSFHVICMYSFIILVEYIALFKDRSKLELTHETTTSDHASSNTTSYIKTTLTIVLLSIQLLVLLPVPQIICNVLGLTFFNAFQGSIKLHGFSDKNYPSLMSDSHYDQTSGDSTHKKENNLIIGESLIQESKDRLQTSTTSNDSLLDCSIAEESSLLSTQWPHLCFRVVTRGLYPDLVRRNLCRNLVTCTCSNLRNFSIEVVTDKALECIDSMHDKRIRQIVVPMNYRSSTGAMFKARALQYALDPGTSPVNDEDYIVHLDEETVLTQNSINGILNFTLNKHHSFGQGLIVYMNDEVINWITTLADSFRVAEDMGKLRFQLAVLHKPFFGWKGSYVVTRCGAERDVSFDHGPDGSIAEDCYFSMIALAKGYSFDFIEGEMLEKSPFTIQDAIRQRKRWIQGFWLVVHSPKIPIRAKFFLAMSCYAWVTLPLTTLSYVVTMIFPVPSYPWVNYIGTFCFAVTLYLYLFGLLKSFDLKESVSKGMLFIFMISQALTLFLNIVIENVAVVWGLIGTKHQFYIVAKEVDHKELQSEA